MRSPSALGCSPMAGRPKGTASGGADASPNVPARGLDWCACRLPVEGESGKCVGLPIDNDAANGVLTCAAPQAAVPPPTFFAEGSSLPEGCDAIVLPFTPPLLLLKEFCVLCSGPSGSAADRQASVAHPRALYSGLKTRSKLSCRVHWSHD